MATLDDKILGEKLHYYCSSSEDEEEPRNQPQQTTSSTATTSKQRSTFRRLKQLPSTNTGPKGVIEDWQRFKQLEAEKREEQDREKLKLIEKLSLTCKSHLDMKKDEKELAELDDLLIENDPIMKEYMKKRMAEMLEKTNIAKKTEKQYGQLIQLRNGNDFLNAIEHDVKDVSVICHIFNDENEICSDINNCLVSLARTYPYVKFCAVHSRDAGVSKDFNENGVPALLVYKNGNLIGNFIRVSDEIGEEIKISNVETYLIQHGILPDKLVPELFN